MPAGQQQAGAAGGVVPDLRLTRQLHSQLLCELCCIDEHARRQRLAHCTDRLGRRGAAGTACAPHGVGLLMRGPVQGGGSWSQGLDGKAPLHAVEIRCAWSPIDLQAEPCAKWAGERPPLQQAGSQQSSQPSSYPFSPVVSASAWSSRLAPSSADPCRRPSRRRCACSCSAQCRQGERSQLRLLLQNGLSLAFPFTPPDQAPQRLLLPLPLARRPL